MKAEKAWEMVEDLGLGCVADRIGVVEEIGVELECRFEGGQFKLRASISFILVLDLMFGSRGIMMNTPACNAMLLTLQMIYIQTSSWTS